DGVYGPETEAALSGFRQEGERAGDTPVSDIKEVREGMGGVGGAVLIETAKNGVENAVDQLHQVEVVNPIIDYVLAGLTTLAAVLAVAAIGWAIYGWLKAKKTVEV